MKDAEFDNVHFDDVKAGEWVQPVKRGYLMKCCDCGLVHRVDFRVVKDNKHGSRTTIQGDRYKAQWRMYREESPA